jgi:hypothetical protein
MVGIARGAENVRQPRGATTGSGLRLVGLGVGAESKLAKRFCITIKYLFVTGIPGTKRGQLNYS